MGPVPINDMQIPQQPPPLPPPKVPKLGFWSKKMLIVLKPMKIQFSDFYFFRYDRFCSKFRCELGTLTTVSSTLCEPD